MNHNTTAGASPERAPPETPRKMPDHLGQRYGLWVLRQAMLDSKAPRYWWATGLLAVFIAIPLLNVAGWMLKHCANRDAAVRERRGEE